MQDQIPTFRYHLSKDFVLSAISMVSEPATERQAEYFEKCKHNFAVQGNNIICVAVECDKPILRYSPSMGYYNIVFDKPTCDNVAQQILRKGLPITVDHASMEGMDATLTGVFQTSPSVHFQDASDGSVIVSYSASPSVIEEFKKRKGMSVEVYFDGLEPFSKVDECLSLIDNL